MEGEEDKYSFPETINQQGRWFGLPLDELVVIAVPVAFGIVYNMTGVLSILAVFLWWVIRRLKKGQGSYWLINLCYWYLPNLLFNYAFKKLPDSGNRHWMK